jgi:hypothetical protein
LSEKARCETEFNFEFSKLIIILYDILNNLINMEEINVKVLGNLKDRDCKQVAGFIIMDIEKERQELLKQIATLKEHNKFMNSDIILEQCENCHNNYASFIKSCSRCLDYSYCNKCNEKYTKCLTCHNVVCQPCKTDDNQNFTCDECLGLINFCNLCSRKCKDELCQPCMNSTILINNLGDDFTHCKYTYKYGANAGKRCVNKAYNGDDFCNFCKNRIKGCEHQFGNDEDCLRPLSEKSDNYCDGCLKRLYIQRNLILNS